MDSFNKVEIEPVNTKALRLEVMLACLPQGIALRMHRELCGGGENLT